MLYTFHFVFFAIIFYIGQCNTELKTCDADTNKTRYLRRVKVSRQESKDSNAGFPDTKASVPSWFPGGFAIPTLRLSLEQKIDPGL